MKNIQKTIKRIGLFLGVFMLVLPMFVLAQENSGSIQIKQLDTDTKAPVYGVRLSLYKVADKNANNSYEITENFKNFDIKPEKLCDGEEYKQNVQYLEKYIEQNHPNSINQKTSDTDGTVTYEGLSDGIYFVKQENSEEDFVKLGYSYETDSYLILLPKIDENGSFTRTIYCKPKGKIQYPMKNESIVVYKIWKDNNNQSGKRPSYITAGLYCDNVLKDKVTLNAANNWTYQWDNLDSSKEWTIKEINIPSGYTSKVTTEENAYTIINTLTKHNLKKRKKITKGGKTGDDTILYQWMAILILSGLVIEFLFYRKRHKE